MGCLFGSNNPNVKGYTGFENLNNAIDIASNISKNNTSLEMIQCFDHISKGHYRTVRYTFTYQKISNYTASFIEITYELGNEPTYKEIVGVPATQIIELKMIEYIPNHIDSDEAYQIAKNNPKIEAYITNGNRCGTLHFYGATFSGQNPMVWAMNWEYSDDHPGINAYIHINAETGEVLKVYTEGVD